jgi:hypothetical protein
MVGIYAKLKNYFSDLPEKVNKAAYKYVLPTVSGLGKVAKYAKIAAPFVNTIVPGLGTGMEWGAQALSAAGEIADKSLQEDWGDGFGIGDFAENLVTGKYAKNPFKGVKGKAKGKSGGVGLSQRPGDLHPRLQLKALPPPDDVYTGSFVEELD